ncbi:hypothetical protein PtA15_4A858 [Puccinia triticina]|uniref:Uncharacterized protein n=1 Tax=Puccinia triticina TaxID=208348 RepID=A0ABY7CI22_9BASI|nr:uncharacterized protein PtA15_4A858 [Puccinia triticina]WAQ84405.1 hypothetical protein PtA15_4A858 [Puccinia triticina]
MRRDDEYDLGRRRQEDNGVILHEPGYIPGESGMLASSLHDLSIKPPPNLGASVFSPSTSILTSSRSDQLIKLPNKTFQTQKISQKMLFKYLLAPVAFAAASVPSYSPGGKSVYKTFDFQTAVTATTQYEKSITSACGQDKVQDVISDLNHIYKPVAENTEKFRSSIEKYDANFLSEQAVIFSGFLKSFENILKAISQRPKIYQSCNAKFSQFDNKFSVIITEFKRDDINLGPAFSKVKLDISLFAKLGFKFQQELGY